jgi:hypothetical protein
MGSVGPVPSPPGHKMGGMDDLAIYKYDTIEPGEVWLGRVTQRVRRRG